ncbi:MAG: alpha/beta hydrolase [Trichlorobacter sp.]
MRQLLHKHLHPLATRHPSLMNVATATADLLRSMAIKPYTPRQRSAELALRGSYHSVHAVRCQLYKEKGAGQRPTIVVGGFVPDATEALEFQRPLLRRHGSIYYLNFPRNGFSQELFCAQLSDLIADLDRQGRRSVLLGVSFGAGLLVQYLRQASEEIHGMLRGLMLISPVLCTDDLVRPAGVRNGGVRMLESNLRKILLVDPTDQDGLHKQVERARRCFYALFEAGADNRPLSGRHLAIRRRIFGVLEHTSALGGYQRVLALRDFVTPHGGPSVFDGPTLLLSAEDEASILVPGSPTLHLLQSPDTIRHLFPNGTARVVSSPDPADPVLHASLIFHQHCYNPRLEHWLERLHRQPLWAAV